MNNRSAPPLRDLPPGRLVARKEHLLAEIASDERRQSFCFRWPRTFRRRVAMLALVGALLSGTAVAATTTWLTGQPAPEAVVKDFESYAPQLGFDPEPRRAVLVAGDGDISLYATTNRQGTYCLVASAPWKRPDKLPDGGTCIPAQQAAAPFIAGLVGASSPPGGQRQTYLIAGRTSDPGARTIRFAAPNGDTVVRPVGSSGFFVATVETVGSACANGDWRPTFTVLGADGEERSHAAITLGSARGRGVCTFALPHPDARSPDVQKLREGSPVSNPPGEKLQQATLDALNIPRSQIRHLGDFPTRRGRTYSLYFARSTDGETCLIERAPTGTTPDGRPLQVTGGGCSPEPTMKNAPVRVVSGSAGEPDSLQSYYVAGIVRGDVARLVLIDGSGAQHPIAVNDSRAFFFDLPGAVLQEGVPKEVVAYAEDGSRIAARRLGAE